MRSSLPFLAREGSVLSRARTATIARPEHDQDVGHVEDTRVERANLKEDEVGDEALPRHPVNQIAGATGHGQRETQERQPAQPGAANQPGEQDQ